MNEQHLDALKSLRIARQDLAALEKESSMRIGELSGEDFWKFSCIFVCERSDKVETGRSTSNCII